MHPLVSEDINLVVLVTKRISLFQTHFPTVNLHFEIKYNIHTKHTHTHKTSFAYVYASSNKKDALQVDFLLTRASAK